MSLGGDTVYMIFHAIKSHFGKGNYDYLKYGGGLNSFDSNSYCQKVSSSEKALYEKLGRKYPNNLDLEHFIVSNVLESNKQLVISDLNRTEATDNYDKWLFRVRRLDQTLSADLNLVLASAGGNSRSEQFNALFRMGDKQHPQILRAFLRKSISIETFLLLDSYLHFFPIFNKHLPADIVWSKTRIRCDQYRPFLNRLILDPTSFRNKLRDLLAS